MPRYPVIWWIAFALMAAPLAWLGWLAFQPLGLSANPIEFINRYLGDWALRALLVALAATPLKTVTGWTWPVRLRRMLGLWAFTYASLHVVFYISIEQFFDFAAIAKDIAKRTYITVGMATLLILTALAWTSRASAVKSLGAKAWKRLHRWVYLAAILACVHYYMMVKADTLPPLTHVAVLAALLGARLKARARAA